MKDYDGEDFNYSKLLCEVSYYLGAGRVR